MEFPMIDFFSSSLFCNWFSPRQLRMDESGSYHAAMLHSLMPIAKCFTGIFSLSDPEVAIAGLFQSTIVPVSN